MKRPESATAVLDTEELGKPDIEQTEQPPEKIEDAIARTRQQLESLSTSIISNGQERLGSCNQSIDLDEKSVAEISRHEGIEAAITEIGQEAKMTVAEASQAIEELISGSVIDYEQLEQQLSSKENGDNLDPTEDRVKRVQALLDITKNLNGEALKSFLERFNGQITPETVRGLEFTLIRAEGEEITFLDAAGRMHQVKVDKKNAGEVLQEVKQSDETLRGNSFNLRTELLRRSEGAVKTHEAYTYGDISKIPKKELKAFLDNPENWLAERRRQQEEIITSELQLANALSARLGDQDPTIYVLRGNTAAGKTTRVREDPAFSRAVDERGQVTGAINPDIYKDRLRRQAVNFGRNGIGHHQAHAEGSMIQRAIKQRLSASNNSMIIDRRMNEADDIQDLMEDSERTGHQVKMLDVDCPLELSLARVLLRPAGSTDPVPPFAAVAEGFEGVRRNRKTMIDSLQHNSKVKEYRLYMSDANGRSVLIAEMKDGIIQIAAGQQERLRRAISPDTSDDIDQMRTMILSDDYIAELSTRLGFSPEMRARLERYRGQTFEQALDSHSTELNEPTPTDDEYQAAAERNLMLTSRTARGTVDTTASADKAEKMNDDLTPELAAQRASDNFTAAIKAARENRDRRFKSPQELTQFIEGLARTINRGITKESVLIRQGADSTKFPYTKIAELGPVMEQFYQELYQRLNDPTEDPGELAAWAEQRIDLQDHFFADGCGKTAKAVSSWILMRAQRRLPDYTDQGKIASADVRTEYYQRSSPREWIDKYKKRYLH